MVEIEKNRIAGTDKFSADGKFEGNIELLSPVYANKKTHQQFEEFLIEVNVFLKDPLVLRTSPLPPSLTPQLMIKRAISYR